MRDSLPPDIVPGSRPGHEPTRKRGDGGRDDAQRKKMSTMVVRGNPTRTEGSRKRSTPAAPAIDGDITSGIHELQFPRMLVDPIDFAELHSTAERATRYAVAVFCAAIGIKYRIPDPRDAEEMARCCGTIHRHLDQYWAKHRGEMNAEVDMLGDDTDADKISSPIACFSASTWAKLAEACINSCSGSSCSTEDISDKKSTTSLTTASDTGHRRDKTFSALKATSFGSVCRQRLAQSAKPISTYTEDDVVMAIEAVAHGWGRITIDEGMLDYIDALRMRCGMLCANARETSATPQKRKGRRRPDAGLVTIVGGGGARRMDKAYEITSARFVKEMEARFLAFAEMREIGSRNRVVFSPEMSRRLAVDEPSNSSVQGRCLHINGDPGNETIVDRIGETFDAVMGAMNVARTLALYARETRKYGTIKTAYRKKLQDVLVCPGDIGVITARYPRYDSSAKNAIKQLRGSRYFDAAGRKSMRCPAEILDKYIERQERIYQQQQEVDASSHNSEGIQQRRRTREKSEYDRRSTATPEEEYAALCAMSGLVRGRFGLDWISKFLVTRSTYRAARKIHGAGGARTLPTVLIAWNTYDIFYRGTIIRTSSIFETLAWWLQIMKIDHGSRVIVSNVSGDRRCISADELCEDERRKLEKDSVRARRGMNIDALPTSSIVVLPLEDLCDIVMRGPVSFVTKVGDLDSCSFSSLNVTCDMSEDEKQSESETETIDGTSSKEMEQKTVSHLML